MGKLSDSHFFSPLNIFHFLLSFFPPLPRPYFPSLEFFYHPFFHPLISFCFLSAHGHIYLAISLRHFLTQPFALCCTRNSPGNLMDKQVIVNKWPGHTLGPTKSFLMEEGGTLGKQGMLDEWVVFYIWSWVVFNWTLFWSSNL